MPEADAFGAASHLAGEVDSLLLFITGVILFFFLLTQGLLIYFAVKYRRKKGQEDRETPYITGNRVLEGVWIAIPALLVMSIFAYGYKVWDDMRTPIPGAEAIEVTASQWLYTFRYADGRQAVNEVRVQKGRPVEFIMTSPDVLHGFFIPEFRVKQDIVPGRYTRLWISPEKPGVYTIYCTQYCGVGHSEMLAKMYVMEPAEYEAWRSGQVKAAQAEPLAGQGKALVEKYGCLACHSIDGTAKVGPSFKGLSGSTVELEGGGAALADEDYLKESIYEPGAKVVKGYRNIMPSFKGTMADDDTRSVIIYIETLK